MIKNQSLRTLVLAGSCGLSLASAAVPETRLTNPFYVFSNGLEGTPEQMANMVYQAGFSGMIQTGSGHVADLIRYLEPKGLKLWDVYREPDQEMAQTMAEGKGKVSILALKYIDKRTEAQALAQLDSVADLAAANGMRVAIYPHYEFYMETADQAIALIKKSGRKNVGIYFNLCHFLMVAQRDKTPYRGLLRAKLASYMPYLYRVAINGADSALTPGATLSWTSFIQVLGKGSYDVQNLLSDLLDLGYKEPIGLQCYAIPGDKMANLRASMEAWKRFQANLPVLPTLLLQPDARRSGSYRVSNASTPEWMWGSAGYDLSGRRMGNGARLAVPALPLK